MALTRYLDVGGLPIDNIGWYQVRLWTLGRSNWLFAGLLRSGQRAANILSLVESAKLNGHEPHAYQKDVLARLPTQKASRIHELLPQHCQPSMACRATTRMRKPRPTVIEVVRARAMAAISTSGWSRRCPTHLFSTGRSRSRAAVS